MERPPKKHVVEEYEEFDFSDLYDDSYVSTVTASPNVTEYEVRLCSMNSITSSDLLCLFVLHLLFSVLHRLYLHVSVG